MFLKIKYQNGRWKSDLVADFKLFKQIREAAGILHQPWPDKIEDYDKLLIGAGQYGIGLEMESGLKLKVHTK